jgi:hypothetical protein
MLTMMTEWELMREDKGEIARDITLTLLHLLYCGRQCRISKTRLRRRCSGGQC